MYKGKNILITGASSGLGKYLALSYANNGGRIINLSRNEFLIDLYNFPQNRNLHL